VRILLIGNSNDSRRRFEGGKQRHEVAQDLLAADLGEAPEFVTKGFWPNDRAPEMVARWIDETDPDVIYLHVGTYPFQYRSVPLRVRRIFRRVGGDAVATAGETAGRNPKWAHRWAFKTGRRLLQRTVGGDTSFTREQVWEVVRECVRIAARREGAVVVVKGPHGRNNYAFSKRQFQGDERERVRLHNDLEAFCEQHHVVYDGIGEGGAFNQPVYAGGTTVGDDVHGDAVRHQHEGEIIYKAIHRALVEVGKIERAAVPTGREVSA